MLSTDVINFIKQHKEDIQHNNFDAVYRIATGSGSCIYDVGRLTDALLHVGINPLLFMSEVPSLYLDGSEVTELEIPKHIEVIRASAMGFSKLQKVTLHDNCELVKNSFANAIHLDNIRIPDIMNEVPESCFFGCTNLTEVDLNDVEQIAEEAFAHCLNLQHIIIPRDVNYIAPSAFNFCRNLTFYSYKDNADVVRTYVDRYKTHGENWRYELI